MKRLCMLLCLGLGVWVWVDASGTDAPEKEAPLRADLPQTEAEWKARLTPEQYRVLREGTTECAFMGDLLKEKRKGTYVCAGCASPLFLSGAKFTSGTGWPSFLQPVNEQAVGTKVDRSYGMVRTEVHCNVCKGHLGHVFPDGPEPTGLRFCINSVALQFLPDEKED